MGLKLFCLLWAVMLTGCLYSVHHFNTGAVLAAGRSRTTLGVGRQPLWRCSTSLPDSVMEGRACDEDGSGADRVSRTESIKASFGYRLGVRDRWGPFPGVELEWHLEAPTDPATMEFAMNLALPSGPSYHHKLGGGWGIGAWADNSFFAEYAISRQVGLPLFFGNLRATYLATPMSEVLADDFSKPLPSHRVLVLQSGLGASFRLPDWILVPDFLIPQINLTLPQIPSGERKFRRADIPWAQWDLNLGIGWGF